MNLSDVEHRKKFPSSVHMQVLKEVMHVYIHIRIFFIKSIPKVVVQEGLTHLLRANQATKESTKSRETNIDT